MKIWRFLIIVCFGPTLVFGSELDPAKWVELRSFYQNWRVEQGLDLSPMTPIAQKKAPELISPLALSTLFNNANVVGIERYLRDLDYDYASLLVMELANKIRHLSSLDKNNVIDVESVLLENGMPYRQALLISFKNKQKLATTYLGL